MEGNRTNKATKNLKHVYQLGFSKLQINNRERQRQREAETDRQTGERDRQTDKTERQTDRQAEETDRQTDRQVVNMVLVVVRNATPLIRQRFLVLEFLTSWQPHTVALRMYRNFKFFLHRCVRNTSHEITNQNWITFLDTKQSA